jgi:hypothetical protein
MWAWFKRLKARLKKLIDDYGWTAIGIYWTIFLSVLGSFWLLLNNGVNLQTAFEAVGFDYTEAAAKTGTLAVAYAATKILQPIRIGISLALTPPIGNWVNARKAAKEAAKAAAGDAATEE